LPEVELNDDRGPDRELDRGAGGASAEDWRAVWERRRGLLLAGLLIAATLLLYAPVVQHGWVNFDDKAYVTGNPHVTSGLSWGNAEWALGTLEMGHWHPLTWLSHMLATTLFGLNPAGHHYMNVLLHAANVALLFWLLRAATGATWRSLAVAALFAVHPLNVETVAWVAERKGLLSAFFSLWMLAAYGWYVRRRCWQRYVAVVTGFVLALMAKEMAVTMPLTLLLVDYWPLGRLGGGANENGADESDGARIDWRRAPALVAEKIPLLMLSAASCLVAVVAQRSSGALNARQPMAEHWKNAIVSYAAYMGKTVWPVRLAVFYPLPASIGWGKVAGALLLLVAMTAAVIRLRGQRYLTTGWLFFLLTLFPVIGVVQLGGQAMADRYAYLPTIGLFMMAVWGVAAVAEEWRRGLVPTMLRPTVLTAVGLCTVAGLAWTTRDTLAHWRDGVTLLTQAETVAGHPDPVIEIDLGEAYSDQGRMDEAYEHFKAAKAVAPHASIALYNIGTYLVQHGEARASVAEFEAAIQYSDSVPVTASSLQNMASAYLMLGEYEHAEAAYTAVLKLDGSHYRSLIGRGRAFYAEGRYTEAEGDFRRAIAISAGPQLYVWLGKALEGEKKPEEARAAYEAALKEEPDLAEARERIAGLGR